MVSQALKMLVLFGQMAAYYGARATAKRLGKQQVYCRIQANAQLFTKDQKYVKSVFYFKRTPEQTFIRTGREKKDIMSLRWYITKQHGN